MIILRQKKYSKLVGEAKKKVNEFFTPTGKKEKKQQQREGREWCGIRLWRKQDQQDDKTLYALGYPNKDPYFGDYAKYRHDSKTVYPELPGIKVGAQRKGVHEAKRLPEVLFPKSRWAKNIAEKRQAERVKILDESINIRGGGSIYGHVRDAKNRVSKDLKGKYVNEILKKQKLNKKGK